MPKGSTIHTRLFKEKHMTNIQRYRANDLAELFDKITKNSIGLDSYIDQFWQTTAQTYPPYNIVQHSNHESSLEIALAGFKKKEVKVYTEHGKLVVEGKKEEKEDVEYQYKGLSNRSFNRVWTISDDTEVRDVKFQDGLLTIELGKIVPEHHARKDWF